MKRFLAAFENFEALHVITRAKGGGYQGLGFAAGENRGAVGARKNSDFDPDGTNLVEGTAIRTTALIENLLAEDALAQNFVVVLELAAAFFIFFRNRGEQFFLELSY